MNQSPVSPNYTYTTPPQNKNLTIPLPAPATPNPQFVSSPVTPHAAPKRSISFPPLLAHHSLMLSSLRTQAKSRRRIDLLLLNQISQVGNASYLTHRHVIIQWMIDVATTFHFHSATLHLAVRHLDAFMSLRHLTKDVWQLVAVTAIFIAAKCEEPSSRVPVLDDLKFICDNAFDHDHIRKMEVCMLRALDWDLVVKTPVHFCNHFLTMMHSVYDRYNEVDSSNYPPISSSSHVSSRLQRASCAGSVAGADEDYDDDDDDDDYNYDEEDCSYISDTDMDDGECPCLEDDSIECDCEAMDMDEEVGIEGGVNTQSLGLDGSSAPISCAEDVAAQPLSPVSDSDDCLDTEAGASSQSRPLKALCKPLESVGRTATCILDVSLHDPSLRITFGPDVIAAAALALATTVGTPSQVKSVVCPELVAYVSGMNETMFSECRTALWEAFVDAHK